MCKVIGIDAKNSAHRVAPAQPGERAHVLFLIDHLAHLGQDQRALLEMSRYLPPERFRASVIALHPRVHPAVRRALGSSLRVIPIRRAYDPSTFRAVRRLLDFIRREKVQLLHTFLKRAEPWVSLVARLAGVRVVLTGRGDASQASVGQGWTARLLRACGLLPSRSLASLPGFAAPQIAGQSHSATPYPAPGPAAGFVEPPGTGPWTRDPWTRDPWTRDPWTRGPWSRGPWSREEAGAAARLLARHGVPANAPVVLTMAHTLPWKGHTSFLHAAALVHRQLPQVHFVVAGAPSNPALFGRLHNTVGDLQLDGFFHFLGKVSDVHSLMRFSQIFCLLSEAPGSHHAVLEAMSAGLPVVATGTGALRSAVEDGSTGFLVEPGDAFSAADRLVRLLQHPELRDAMGAAAGERAHRESSAEERLGRLAGMYEELLASS